MVFSQSQSAFSRVSNEIDILINQAKELNQELQTLSLTTVDLLRQPSGKYDNWVYYSPLPSASIPSSSITATCWDDNCNTVSSTVQSI